MKFNKDLGVVKVEGDFTGTVLDAKAVFGSASSIELKSDVLLEVQQLVLALGTESLVYKLVDMASDAFGKPMKSADAVVVAEPAVPALDAVAPLKAEYQA